MILVVNLCFFNTITEIHFTNINQTVSILDLEEIIIFFCFKEYMSDPVINYNYIEDAKVSVSIKN